MQEKALQQALALAERCPVYVATADEAGTPHLACAAGLSAGQKGRVLVTEWFCPGTVSNVEHNRRVSLTVWDPETDAGHQIIGEVERLEEVGMMDGYAPGAEPDEPMPQVQRQLIVRVEKVLDFSRAPHTDRVEAE
jgi:pyridoxine/pyridoxamine 5'-phosphate oxidase